MDGFCKPDSAGNKVEAFLIQIECGVKNIHFTKDAAIAHILRYLKHNRKSYLFTKKNLQLLILGLYMKNSFLNSAFIAVLRLMTR